jgi:PIN domain nuclease of toxin-antitoxin system
MGNRYVVDTHAVVWFVEGNPRLGGRAAEVLRDPNSDLVMSAVALGEACWMVEHGKTKIPSLEKCLSAIDSERRLTIFPLTAEIVRISATLPSHIEMHDRQIVATAMLLSYGTERVPLVTRDMVITNSKLVEVVW